MQHYEVEFIMRQRWDDPRLIHDDGDRHAFLNGIHHHGDIWKPDIYFIKHGTFKVACVVCSGRGDVNTDLRRITWTPAT